MPGDPRECRQLAVECLYLAQQATSDSGRQDYTALAHTWIELAHVFESDDALLKNLSAAGWNVVPLESRWPIKLRAS
jgi:hypothetical protein